MRVVVIPILSALLGTSCLSVAQVRPLTRYEQQMKASDDGFTIISLKEEGIGLIRDLNKYEGGKRFWGVTLLDNQLKETWTGEIALLPRFNLIGFDAPEDGYLYFLYREGDVNSSDLLLVTFNVTDKSVQQLEIKHEFNFRLTHFSVLSNKAILGGYATQEPAVVLFDLKSTNLKVVPGFFLRDTELLDVRTNRNGTFNAVLMERHQRDQRNLVVRTFDATGALLLEDIIEIDRETTILTAITSRLEREELMIAGTYSLGNSKQASGYFITKVDPFADQPVNFYPLTSLDHFLDYLKPKRAARIKMKAQRRLDAGKAPVYKSHLQPLRLIESDQGFVLLSEAYNSSSDLNQPYWNNTYYPFYSYGFAPYRYSPYGNRYYQSPYAYDQTSRSGHIETFESVATAFDPEGKLQWDHSFELDTKKTDGLEQISDLMLEEGDDHQVHLMYKKEQQLLASTRNLITDGVTLDTCAIPKKDPMDIVRFDAEQEAGLRKWYDKYLFLWGYQSIRNKSDSDSGAVRYVFYLVKYELE